MEGGGGILKSRLLLISEGRGGNGPILKIQTAFESPGKLVEGKINSLGVASGVTGQVKVQMRDISVE